MCFITLTEREMARLLTFFHRPISPSKGTKSVFQFELFGFIVFIILCRTVAAVLQEYNKSFLFLIDNVSVGENHKPANSKPVI